MKRLDLLKKKKKKKKKKERKKHLFLAQVILRNLTLKLSNFFHLLPPRTLYIKSEFIAYWNKYKLSMSRIR